MYAPRPGVTPRLPIEDRYKAHRATFYSGYVSPKDVKIMKASRLVSLIAIWVIVTTVQPSLWWTAALIPWRYRRYCRKLDRRHGCLPPSY